ncbi:MAG UNVERIFIED_CONTAM: hypothetical protein LVT10_08720 [Anaerolineae bacterium]|jgi:hypothetical protein
MLSVIQQQLEEAGSQRAFTGATECQSDLLSKASNKLHSEVHLPTNSPINPLTLFGFI